MRRRTPVATAPKVALVERWHPEPGARYFVAGETVRIDGERGGRYRLLGFKLERDRMVAELFGGKRGRTPATDRAPRLRTVHADRLRRV